MRPLFTNSKKKKNIVLIKYVDLIVVKMFEIYVQIWGREWL